MIESVARSSLIKIRKFIKQENMCSRTIIDQAHHNGSPYFTVSTYKGPRLDKVSVFKAHEKHLVRRLFGPGVPIPWAKLERTGSVEIRAPIFSE